MAPPSHPAAAEASAAATNGHATVGSGTRRPPGPSARPAAVVFGIILVVFLAGAIADAITSSHGPSVARSPAAAAVPGTGGLVPEPGKRALAPIVTSGQPPTDIVSAVVVPSSAQVVPGSAIDRAVGLYDAQLGFEVPASAQSVITFLRTELAAGAWHVLSAEAVSGGGYRFIAQHPSGDGYEWELGVTVSPSVFHSSVPGMAVPAAGVTPMSLRLFAASDQS